MALGMNPEHLLAGRFRRVAALEPEPVAPAELGLDGAQPPYVLGVGARLMRVGGVVADVETQTAWIRYPAPG